MNTEIKIKKNRLSLNKETLSQINDQQMKAIAGGAARAAATSVQEPVKTAALVEAGSNCCSSANTACC